MPHRTRYVLARIWLRRWTRSWTRLAVVGWTAIILCGTSIVLNAAVYGGFWPLYGGTFGAAVFATYWRGRLDSTLWWSRRSQHTAEVYESLVKRSLATTMQQNAWIIKHLADDHIEWQGPIQ